MERQLKQVEQFQRAFGHPIAEQLTLPKMKRFLARHKWLKEEVRELKEAYIDEDHVKMADAICDIFYIALGTAIECGLQNVLTDCFDEVQRSNMTKLDAEGKPVYGPDGKVKKSEMYTKPDLKSIIYGHD